MADEVVTEQAPAAPASQPAGEPSAPNAQPPASPTPAPAADAQQRAWDAKEKAFIADLQKERRARREVETQAHAHKTELELERKRVQALSGVNPRNAQETEIAEVRERFAQLYPELAGLTKEDIDALRELRTRSTELQETTSHYWTTHGRTMLASLETEVAKEYGGEKLTPRQAKQLHHAYTQAAQDDPDFLKRHERGDQTLIAEFAKDFIEDWLKPAQRKAQAAELGRNRPLPQGKDRSVTTSTGKKIDVNDPKAVEDLLVAGFRDRGGRFRNE